MLSNPYCVALGGRRRGDIERVPKNHAYKDEESFDFRDRRHGGNRRVLSREEYRDFGKIPQEDGDYRTTAYKESVSNCDVSDDDLDGESLIPDTDYTDFLRRDFRGVVGRRAVRTVLTNNRAESVSNDKSRSLLFLHGVSAANRKWIDQREGELYKRVKLDESNLRKFDRRMTQDSIHDAIGTSLESVPQFVKLTGQRRVVLCQNLEESKMKVGRLLDTVSRETFTQILDRRVKSDWLLLRNFDSVAAWIDRKKQELGQRILSYENNLRNIDSNMTPEFIRDNMATSPSSISELVKVLVERRVDVCQKLKMSRKELSKFLLDAKHETMSDIFIRHIPPDELAKNELGVETVRSEAELLKDYRALSAQLIKSNDRLLLDGENLINFESLVTQESTHDVKLTAERRDVLRQKCIESEIKVETLKDTTKRARHRLRLTKAAIMSQQTLAQVQAIIDTYGSAILVGMEASSRANRSSQHS